MLFYEDAHLSQFTLRLFNAAQRRLPERTFTTDLWNECSDPYCFSESKSSRKQVRLVVEVGDDLIDLVACFDRHSCTFMNDAVYGSDRHICASCDLFYTGKFRRWVSFHIRFSFITVFPWPHRGCVAHHK